MTSSPSNEDLSSKPSQTTSDQTSLRPLITSLLEGLGEDPHREGLLSTPKRVEKSLRFLTEGYTQTLDEIVGEGIFSAESSDIVLVKDIELFSMCEHHMLPFFGKAHVAYIPDQSIIGLSKIPRIVNMFARRLQVQERLGSQVASSLMEILKPKGVAVVIDAHHLCMMMRGVEKQQSSTVTSTVLGTFRQNAATRAELMQLISL